MSIEETPEAETTPAAEDGSSWRLIDHTHAAGLSRGHMWLKGAVVGLEQARRGGEMWGLWLGVLQCVQSLHHVRKCVAMSMANVGENVKTDIERYLQVFDEEVPHLKTIRDVFEHYEDGYALGKGNLQQPEVKPWQRTMSAALSEEWTIIPDYADRDMTRPIVTVANKYVLDLSEAVRAAEWLLWKLWERTRLLKPTVGEGEGVRFVDGEG
ncbi:hypothetical protein GCM10009817_16840 [Terrabacter lapilli]|uniref:HEPN AbiU2-like domain-containing protein n=1 Tax=Terrabacter lapilli TaxID=436231 RepID=A0ABN2RYA5_9MICO